MWGRFSDHGMRTTLVLSMTRVSMFDVA